MKIYKNLGTIARKMLETPATIPDPGKNAGSDSEYALEQNVAVAPTPVLAPATALVPEKWSGSRGFGCKSLPSGFFHGFGAYSGFKETCRLRF